MKEIMRWKKYIPVLIYLLLFLMCLAVVVLIGRFTGSKEEDETSSSWEEPASTAPEQKEEPSREQEESEEEKTEPPSDTAEERWGRWRGIDREPPEETEPEEEPYVPPVIMLASDLHYMSRDTHDEGIAFWDFVAQDDGKVSQYSDIMVDTLAETAVRTAPSALVLTGDITLNGEKENHLKLAEKLYKVAEAGIPVLVIPGNHDIKNENAAEYFGEEKTEAEYLETGEDFAEIYHEFGYDQAFSRDEASLSYLYALDDTHWMAMLDTCQYEDRNHVEGRIKEETLDWLDGYLAQAREQGIEVLPVGHHNLLSESRLYTIQCTMENHQDIIRLFEEYELPLYISGHLHAQRIKKHKWEPGAAEDAYGISEIVLPPYSIPPCQYGRIKWEEDGGMAFETGRADVESCAAAWGCEDENLLQFGRYGPEFMKNIIKEQVKKSFGTIPDYLKDEMADLYSGLYYDYCAGNRMEWDDVRFTRAFRLWERFESDSRYKKNMSQMVEDVKQDLHGWRREKAEKE